MQTLPAQHATSQAQSHSFAVLLSGMLQRPQQILIVWNWKSALLSIVLRGPIFLIAGLRHGWQAAVAALLTETIFCAGSAGFSGAVVQTLKDAQPQWLTGVFLIFVMPMIFQVLEYLLHWFMRTPHLRVAAIVSLVVSAVAALFNWYAMRRGTLLVGGEGGGFGSDLLRLPRLLFAFFTLLPRQITGDKIAGNKIAEKKIAGSKNGAKSPVLPTVLSNSGPLVPR